VREWRVADVPFGPDAGELLLLPSASMLKRLPAHALRVELLAIDDHAERSLGTYTFAHTPS
jgi:hypothetical protein